MPTMTAKLNALGFPTRRQVQQAATLQKNCEARTRRRVQQDTLIQDGRKALAAIDAGRPIKDLLLMFPGSRARLYRAINAARAAMQPTARRATDMADSIDPLFL